MVAKSHNSPLSIHCSHALLHDALTQLCAVLDITVGNSQPVLSLHYYESPLPHLMIESSLSPSSSIELPQSLNVIAKLVRYEWGQAKRNNVAIFGGAVLFDIRQRILHQDASDLSVKLTEREADILQSLLDVGADGVSREEILCRWEYHEQSDTHTIDTHIYRLRQKLETSFAKEMFIRTGDGRYYLQSL